MVIPEDSGKETELQASVSSSRTEKSQELSGSAQRVQASPQSR